MARDQGHISVHYIPKNFSNGINILGFNFKVRNMLEGIFLGLIAAVLMYIVLGFIPGFDIGSRIGSCVAVLLAGTIGGIIGLNGEPLSEFFMNYMRYKNNKRTAFYNPRVKLETVSYKEIKLKKDENRLENRIKKKINEKMKIRETKNDNQAEAEQINNYFDAEKMFFKDDEGIIKKPKEYMDNKELQNYEKEQAEREKNIMKLAKKIERDKRYNEQK